MINCGNLKVGDIVGTTSGSPIATLIKMRTWGIQCAFSQKKSSHIATVIDRGQGLLYLAEMSATGLDLTEIHAYDHRAPLQHIVFVGRHKLLEENAILRDRYNTTILTLHAKKVKYGYEDLLNFITEMMGFRIRDKPSTLICSELPILAFHACGISYPTSWEIDCSPAYWQCWPMLRRITPFIIS